MSANIVDTLRRVKALAHAVSTVFYYNSVCNFPQYASLYDQYAAAPGMWLRRSARGGGDPEPVFLSCAGFFNSTKSGKYNHSYPHKGMPQRHADLQLCAPGGAGALASECANATRSGVVDGCFSDRAVDGSRSKMSLRRTSPPTTLGTCWFTRPCKRRSAMAP